MYFKLKSC